MGLLGLEHAEHADPVSVLCSFQLFQLRQAKKPPAPLQMSKRMSGQIHARQLLFHPQQLIGWEFLHPGNGDTLLDDFTLSEQIQLSLDQRPAAACLGIHNLFKTHQHFTPVVPQAIQRTAPDQILHCPLAHIPPDHPVTEIRKAAIHPVFLPFPDYLANHALAQSFDCQQAEVNPLPSYGKAHIADIHIRSAHCYALFLAQGNILHELGGIAQHTGHQRSHILRKVMTFQIGGLIGKIGIGCRMGFVEGIGRKAGHLVKDFIGRILRNPVGYRSGAAH